MKIAFTISTANYLYLAKTVGTSFLKHNPEYHFIIYLFDKNNGRIDLEEFGQIQIVEIEPLNIIGFTEMVNRYTIFEMCNALKPFVTDYIFNNFNSANTLIYLDSDLMFYNHIKIVEEALINNSIIITPHIESPMPLDNKSPDEKVILNSGIYNGGFFALRRSTQTFAFIKWWKQHLETECLVDFSKGLFVDQIWLNFVPIYFSETLIFRNPGYNVAYWNLYEREVSYNGTYFVNENAPLVFFHFSGYNFTNPNSISKHQNRFNVDDSVVVHQLFNNYKENLVINGHEKYSELECYYYQFSRANMDIQKWKMKNRIKKKASKIFKQIGIKK